MSSPNFYLTTSHAGGVLKWSIKIMTIREFLAMVHNVDVDPIHNRPAVFNYTKESLSARHPTKRQSIIGAIMRGIDISEIKLNLRTEKERLNYSQLYESIDGSNRMRSIVGFYTNDFPTNVFANPEIGNKTFAELSEKQKEAFLNYKLRVVVYERLLPEEKLGLWITTNTLTPLNEQEKLNGAGDHPLANMIRELARRFNYKNSTTNCHPLFDIRIRPKEGDMIGEHLTFVPTRLSYDRFVARIAVCAYNGSQPTNCDDVDIRRLYFDKTITPAVANTLRKKIVECLNFILKIAEEKKAAMKVKLTEDECIMLMRLWCSYKKDYGTFSIEKYHDYYTAFRRAWIRFNKDTDDKYALKDIPSYDKKAKENRARWAMFKDNHNKGGKNRWLDNIEWIENRYLSRQILTMNGILVRKSKRKTLPRDQRDQMLLNKQKGKCGVQNMPLNLIDAHAAHIVPLSKGGTNDPSNIMMVSAKHNRDMGTMNLNTYKKTLHI